jgi:hypothetical protein
MDEANIASDNTYIYGRVIDFRLSKECVVTRYEVALCNDIDNEVITTEFDVMEAVSRLEELLYF